jgi:hypothetical protein
MKITLKQAVKYKGQYHSAETTLDVAKDIAAGLIGAGAAVVYQAPVETSGKQTSEEEQLIKQITAAQTLEELEKLVPENEQRDAITAAATARWQEIEAAQK